MIGEFEKNFSKFVTISSNLVIQQTQKRRDSAERHHKIMEALITYLVQAFNNPWRKQEAYNYCRYYEPKAFEDMEIEAFESFLIAKSLRSKRSINDQKKIWDDVEAEILEASKPAQEAAKKEKEEKEKRKKNKQITATARKLKKEEEARQKTEEAQEEQVDVSKDTKDNN